jgi:hypothetical protein
VQFSSWSFLWYGPIGLITTVSLGLLGHVYSTKPSPATAYR